MSARDEAARGELERLAREVGLDVAGGRLRRTSSRFCLGVEHGDYNGTELFGVGTDRFLWLAWKPNDRGRVRLCSTAFRGEGVVEYEPGRVPPRRDRATAGRWARFPFGVDHVLRTRGGLRTSRGCDVVVHGDIPGGGMSRSASLTLNLILTQLELHEQPLQLGGSLDRAAVEWGLGIVDLARAVENDYIGSPCGVLDQTMILFARAGMGTHFRPRARTVEHVPLGGEGSDAVRFVSLDTGTVRPGLESSTYAVRRRECEELLGLVRQFRDVETLADLASPEDLRWVDQRFGGTRPELVRRLAYLVSAQGRFERMLEAWRAGDVETLGEMFRADGRGLRDDYQISGPELETMCDLARTVPGVLGERMLGGGDKGAAGALVRPEAVEDLRRAVALGYPRSHPDFAGRFAVHDCALVDGVVELGGL